MASNSETGHAKNVANFQTLINHCTGLGAAYQSEIAEKQQQVEAIDALLSGASPAQAELLDAQRNALLTQMALISAHSAALTDSLQASTNAKATTTAIENSGLTTTKIFETNQKKVNEIFLTNIPQGNLLLGETAYHELYDIAIQCPVDGGNAVFFARSLLALVNDSLAFDNAQLCSSGGERSANHPPNEATGSFGIYPNPATDQVLVATFTDSEESLELVLYSLAGTVMGRYAVPANGIEAIPLSEFQSGLYVCRIVQSGKLLYAQRLAIIH